MYFKALRAKVTWGWVTPVVKAFTVPCKYKGISSHLLSRITTFKWQNRGFIKAARSKSSNQQKCLWEAFRPIKCLPKLFKFQLNLAIRSEKRKGFLRRSTRYKWSMIWTVIFLTNWLVYIIRNSQRGSLHYNNKSQSPCRPINYSRTIPLSKEELLGLSILLKGTERFSLL